VIFFAIFFYGIGYSLTRTSFTLPGCRDNSGGSVSESLPKTLMINLIPLRVDLLVNAAPLEVKRI